MYTGGHGSSGLIFKSGWTVLDPVTTSCSGTMPDLRPGIANTYGTLNVAQGIPILCGGMDSSFMVASKSTCEQYNWELGAWQDFPTAVLSPSRMNHASVQLTDSKFIITGMLLGINIIKQWSEIIA